VPTPAPNAPQKDYAHSFAAAAGLLIMALHGMGLGLTDASQVLNSKALAQSLPEIWPYVALAAGVLARRRWARDLASPAAFLGLVAALAVFPRYLFLDQGYSLTQAGAGHAPHHLWAIFRQQLIQEASTAAVCAATFYALTRPSIVSQSRADLKQPEWTKGLGFAARLLLLQQFISASDLLNKALYTLPQWPDLKAFFAAPQDLLGSPALKAMEPAGIAVLALLALVGLMQRRPWGWLAMAVQSLILLTLAIQGGFAKALTAYSLWQGKAPSAAPYLASEAFCRSLPELAVLACVFGALLSSKREFHVAP
jgi:hypothetical protein